jgi:hypothetical protein
MAAVYGYAILLLLCALIVEFAVTEAEVAHGSAIRMRGPGRTPGGRRRQQVRLYRVFSSYETHFISH